MRLRLLLGLAVILFCWGVASAQESDKAEITGDYSYFRFNPGLPSYFNSQNLNGGGGQATLYFKSWVGIAADFQGYGSYTQCLKPNNPLGATGCASANLFTYTFGPQFKYRVGRAEPFAEVLVGGAHSNFYANACRNVSGICASISPSNNAFALVIGGGVDIRATEHIAIRIVDADYELTRFGNNFTNGNNSQSNFRFQTGVQLRF
ncbi:MAG TPA: outer membrane beta-barrel protein [Candidatus Sulfotelmatobacter sp.]|nr:outer membrane beta-barrel protein [Candidatus Sulfotelmatobacter sp.]